MKEEFFDIEKVFEDTKKTLEAELVKNSARIEFIDELQSYFKSNNLKVVRQSPDQPEEKDKKEAK